jgi:hypothetical protein
MPSEILAAIDGPAYPRWYHFAVSAVRTVIMQANATGYFENVNDFADWAALLPDTVDARH